MMKQIDNIIFILLIIFPILSYSQQNNDRFICKTDSLIHIKAKELKVINIDTIIYLMHRYDNGFVNKNTDYLIWKKNGIISMYKVSGFDTLKTSHFTNCPFDRIFDYYFKVNIDTIKSTINYPSWQSHDMVYLVNFYYNNEHYSFQISDYQRGMSYDIEEDEIPVDEPEYRHLLDPRIIWINMIDKLIKEY